MALKPELQAKIDEIQDEANRKAVVAALEAHPELAAGFMADADYQRKIQTVADQERTLKADRKKWEDWYEDSSQKFAELDAEKTRLEQELSKASAGREGAGSGLSDEDGEGAASSQDLVELRKTIDDMQKRMETMVDKDFYEKDIGKKADNLNAFSVKTVEAQQRHAAEFGEPLKSDDLYAFMSEHKIQDIDTAYDRLTQSKRQEKWETDKSAEIEARLRKELAASNAGNFPTGEGTSPQDIGPVQARHLKHSRDDGIPDDVAADGSGQLGALVGAKLRAEGKA